MFNKLSFLKCFILIIIFMLLIFCSSAFAEAGSLEIVNVDILAEILSNGDMKVIEERTIFFDGLFRGADQIFNLKKVSGYDQFAL